MGTETLEINLNKETNFDFELSITGMSANDAKVRFGIELPGFTMQIPCSRGDDKTWNVTVPPLDNVAEEGQYTFTIELIANGYHFAPVKGAASLKPIAEVVGTVPRKSIEVNVSGIKKATKKETKEEKAEEKVVKKAEKKAEKKVEKKGKTKKEEVKESIIDRMINKRFKPFEQGKSIISQLNNDDLTEQEKNIKQFLQNEKRSPHN